MRTSAMQRTNRLGWSRSYCLITAYWALCSFAVAAAVQIIAGPQEGIFLTINWWAASHTPDFWASVTMLGHTGILMCWMSPLLVYRPQLMMAFVAALPAGSVFSLVLKHVFSASRPGDLLQSMDFNHMGMLLSGHSFPSGHSITIFAAAAVICARLDLRPGRRTRAGLVAVSLSLASLVGLSRLAVGAHWLGDVVAGASLGWLAGLSGVWVCDRYTHWWQANATHLLTLLTLSVFALSAHHALAPSTGTGWVVWVACASVATTLALKALGRHRSTVIGA
jgi:membrane-associated phospholipid phosphatase